MLITTKATTKGAFPATRSVTLSATSESETAPGETFTPSDAKPKELYPAWTPFANAGVAAAVVGIPAFFGAAGNAAFGASEYIPLGISVLAAGTAGTLAYKSAAKGSNKHPVWTGFSTVAAGGIAAVAAPFLSIPGAAYGWKGAVIATAVAAIGTGVVTAFGIHSANEKIAQHNANLGKNPA